jgi:autotransporter translocation and assembly factor TamB
VLVWIAGIVLGLIVLIGVGLAVVLSSPAVARKVIALGLRHAPPGLTIGGVHGRLRGPLLLTAVRYDTPRMQVAIDSIEISWRLSHLLERQLQLDRLHVIGVHVVLPDSTPPASNSTSSHAPPHLPVAVHLGDVLVRDVAVAAPDSIAVHLDSVRLSGRATAYALDLHGAVRAPRVRRVDLALTGNGSLEQLSIDSADVALLEGQVGVHGSVGWWPAVHWSVAARVRRLHPNLVMTDTSSWPAVISANVTTAGTVDSNGPAGHVALDSLRGTLRHDSLRGTARAVFAPGRYTIDTLDLAWGSINAQASGRIDSTLDMRYHLAAASLRTVSPRLSGSVALSGIARGPRAMPHVQLSAVASRIRSGTNRVAHVTIKADANVAPHGRIDIALRADSAVVSQRVIRSVTLDAHGTRDQHVIDVAAHSTSGDLLLAAHGGIHGNAWSGSIDTLRVDSTAAGAWQLRQRAALDVSSVLIHLDTLCVTSRDSVARTDSTSASLCLAGEKRPTSWRAAIDATELPLTWLAHEPADAADTLSGTVGAHIRASAHGARISATAHLATQHAALAYRQTGSKKEKRLTVDSAVIDARIGSGGAQLTAGVLISDQAAHPLASLTANASLPHATRLDASLRRSPLDATIDAHADNLAFVAPFIRGVDSLGGALDMHATATGSVARPSIDGAVQLQHVVAGLSGLRSVRGSVDLTASVSRGDAGAFVGTLAVVPHDVRYADRQLGQERWLGIGGAGLSFTSSAHGAQGKLDVVLSSDSGSQVASLKGSAQLPEYGGATPLDRQRATITVNADVANLHALQMFTTSVDSLRGQFHLVASLSGRIATPTITATMSLDSLHALLPIGSTVQGGLTSALHVAVAPDSAISGTLSLMPVGMTFSYTQNDSVQRVSLDSSSLTLAAGPAGVHGNLLIAFAGEGHQLGQLQGTIALPAYSHIGRAASREPVTASLTGRIPDLSFIRAFTPMIDSAAGSMSLDSRVTGTIADSRMVGSLEVHRAAFHLPALGITLDSVTLSAHGDDAGSVSLQASMHSGGGSLTIAGESPVNPTAAHPGKIHIEGHRFEAAHRAQMRAVVSPDLDIAITNAIRVTGQVRVPLAHLQLVNIPASAIAPSDDVVLIDTTSAQSRSLPIGSDVRVIFGDSVTFSGFNFNTRLSGGLRVMQQPEHLATASGTIVIDSGTYKAYGQDLTIQNGKVQFAGGAINNPGLDIRASRTAEDSVVAGLDIQGTLKQPQVTIFSQPAMSQTEALSYIVTGHGVGQGTGSSGNLVSKALSALGLRGGNAIAGTLGHTLHLDEAKIQTEGDIKQASFVAGTYLSPNVFISYGIGLFDPVSTLKLRYIVSSHFTLQAQTGQATSADILVKTSSHKP